MAYGVSALAILSGMRESQLAGGLISIDPHQSTDWEGCGLRAVDRAGLSDRHTLIEEFDYTALPKLQNTGLRIEFAFIDGWHTFDYTLLDFWYVDKMLAVGGIVGFDDCDMPAVHKVIQFVLSHRRYEEIDVGLPADFVVGLPVTAETFLGFRGRIKRAMGGRVLNALRQATGGVPRVYTQANRYFRKVKDWQPKWDFYADF
jgi:hypothetical protein